MISMTSQRKQFNIVISDLSKCNSLNSYDIESLSFLLSVLSQNGFTYFAIVHDKDLDSNGVLKRTHLHIVLKSNATKRAKQVLGILSDLFLTNDENIQIQECLDLVASVQYLVHMNDENKYRYLGEDIITNDLCLLGTLLKSDLSVNVITTDFIIELCESGMSLKEILYTIGLSNYIAYRSVIKDLL